MLSVPNYVCFNCHNPMTYIDYNRNHYCQLPNCQRALAKTVTEEKQRKRDELYKDIIAKCEESFKDLAKSLTHEKIPIKLMESIQQNTPVVALMPVNKNILCELPEARKEIFLAHLMALFEDIKTDSEMTLKVYDHQLETPLTKSESALLGHACATCKGYCCGLGSTHGFQDYPSLKYYLSSQPEDFSAEELKEVYCSYIPKQSYRNACVFQGKLGCTLPREMRSFTCNNYRCARLSSYHNQVATSDSKLTYAVAVDHEKIIGTSVFNTEHFARHI